MHKGGSMPLFPIATSFCLNYRTCCFLESEVKVSSDSDLRQRKLCENNTDHGSIDSKQNLIKSMQLSNIINFSFLFCIYGLVTAILTPFFIKQISTQRSEKPEYFFLFKLHASLNNINHKIAKSI